MQKSQITIVGGGVAGLSLALILDSQGFMVTLCEKNKLPTQDNLKVTGRTVALMNESLNVLEMAGVWPEFQKNCTRLETLSIIDDSLYPRGVQSMVRQDFKASEVGSEFFGYNVPLPHMTATLADKVRHNKNIIVVENFEFSPDHDVIKNADLVVGADGRKSVIREWANIRTMQKDYGQTAITCLISHSQPHDFNSVEFHRTGGPCTFVPCLGNTSAVVWVEKTKDAESFLKLPKASFIQAIQDRSRNILGKIDLVTDPESWPLMTLKSSKITAPKVALIAEAAHVLSPIGAQGLNLSLRDVGRLAKVLNDAKNLGQDIGELSTLYQYEKARIRDLSLRYFGVDMLNQMVANSSPFLRGVRRFGLRALNYIGPLRTVLVKEGLAAKS